MKKIISFVITGAMICNVLAIGTLPSFAHSTMLEVTYDNCYPSENADGRYEMWYVLNDSSYSYHFNHEEHTIKYYFEDKPGGSESWSNIQDADEIQNAYANSMKKWNDVYFYTYDSHGNVEKNKIINIVEGTVEDHNLSIYPEVQNNNHVAETQAMNGYYVEEDIIGHLHYSEWEMGVNIRYFTNDSEYGIDIVNSVRERTGAHEIGHILGLFDVDYNNLCGADADNEHHYELLMGYGDYIPDRSKNITYKDIAGVAITRGFHTDDDHKWMNHGMQSDGTYRLICSICNGVRCVDNLSGYSYVTYRLCSGNHILGLGYMMPVASYEMKDYYKCMYCEYVAPFSLIVTQNYIKTSYSASHHKCVNDVLDLDYTFYEEHDFTIPINPSEEGHILKCACSYAGTEVEAHYSHSYGRYNKISHYVYCECGYQIGTGRHIVPAGGGIGFKLCIYCGERLDTSIDITPVPGTNSVSIRYITEAGSYVNADGVVFLVESDMQLLLAGQLDVEALVAAPNNTVTE